MKIYEYLEKIKRKEFLLNKLLNPYEDKLSVFVNKGKKLDELNNLSKFQSPVFSFENRTPNYISLSLLLQNKFNSTHNKFSKRSLIPPLSSLNYILQNNVIERLAEQLDAKIDSLSAFEYVVENLEENSQKKEGKVKVFERAIKIIRDTYYDHNLLQIIQPREFKEVIAELLYDKGFKVELTKQTRDGCFDILAMQNISGFDTKFLVECKRYTKGIVGIDIIRSFCDVIKEEQANKGIICTTSYFSKDSIKRSDKMGHILDLKDRMEIINWVNDYNKGINKP